MGGKGHQNMFLRIITLPIRFLKKGKNMYVKSMMDVAQKPRYGSSHKMGSMKQSSKAASALPKSFSTSVTPSWSSNLEGDDLRELIRANSTTYINNDPNNKLRADMDLYLKQLLQEQQMKKLKESLVNNNNNNRFSSSKGVVPRSISAGMGKIDEEKPFEEEDEEEEGSIHVKKSEVMFPRSKSHAVTQTSGVY